MNEMSESADYTTGVNLRLPRTVGGASLLRLTSEGEVFLGPPPSKSELEAIAKVKVGGSIPTVALLKLTMALCAEVSALKEEIERLRARLP